MKKLYLFLFITASVLVSACSKNINFQDANTKVICTLKWDTNNDKELSYKEAAAVVDLGTTFTGSPILAFPELEHFTGLRGITKNAFAGCVNLRKITLPKQISSIGENAFYGCEDLKEIEIPHNVNSIGASAFYGCSGELIYNGNLGNYHYNEYPTRKSGWLYGSKFTSLTIGNEIGHIDAYIFKNMSITSVTISDTVYSVGEDAFAECEGLKSVKVSNLSTWCKISFDNYRANPLSNGATLYVNDNAYIHVTIPSDVQHIGARAFAGYHNLKSVTIPDTLLGIGTDAFAGCNSLESVNISNLSTWCKIIFSNDYANPLYAYYYNSPRTKEAEEPVAQTLYKQKRPRKRPVYQRDEDKRVQKYHVPILYINGKEATDIAIPSNIQHIRSNCFAGYNHMTSITIPNGVTEIGEAAFEGCNNLDSVAIPNSVTKIGSKTFKGCRNLASVTIPNSVTEIEEAAFEGCNNLDSVAIPNGVTKIGQFAFRNCSSLTSISIPDSVTDLGVDAFAGCNEINSIHGKFASKDNRCLIINDELVFVAKSGLTTYTIPNDVTKVGQYTFMGCDNLTSITIPNSVTEIDNCAFEECINLRSATIGKSVTNIGNSAFKGCSSLSNIIIPNSVTEIEGSAFQDCTSLESVTIGKNITDIGYDAFDNCSNLKVIYCKAITPPSAYRAFDENRYSGWWSYYYKKDITIYVPSSSESTYKDSYSWNDAGRIVGYNF